jgi:putative hydrolase of the HAD superfamily
LRFADAVLGIPEETLETLRALRAKGLKLALVSNADVSEVASWDRAPIAPLFDAVVFSCHVGHAKPDVKIYRIALEKLSVKPHEAIFVGDGAMNELAGAKAAGISTVMMTGIVKHLWPERIEERRPYADFIIESIGELRAT